MNSGRSGCHRRAGRAAARDRRRHRERWCGLSQSRVAASAANQVGIGKMVWAVWHRRRTGGSDREFRASSLDTSTKATPASVSSARHRHQKLDPDMSERYIAPTASAGGTSPHGGGERRRSGIGHLHPRDAELAECLTHCIAAASSKRPGTISTSRSWNDEARRPSTKSLAIRRCRQCQKAASERSGAPALQRQRSLGNAGADGSCLESFRASPSAP